VLPGVEIAVLETGSPSTPPDFPPESIDHDDELTNDASRSV